MPIWFGSPTPASINAAQSNNMGGHLGLVVTEIGDDFVRGTLPVDHRTKQPMGVLHGGASVVLAESLGSIAANLVVDSARFACLGQESTLTTCARSAKDL
jgi:1,4-dihydroxy-2-naphthoyl-CoA hydrolase